MKNKKNLETKWKNQIFFIIFVCSRIAMENWWYCIANNANWNKKIFELKFMMKWMVGLKFYLNLIFSHFFSIFLDFFSTMVKVWKFFLNIIIYQVFFQFNKIFAIHIVHYFLDFVFVGVINVEKKNGL